MFLLSYKDLVCYCFSPTSTSFSHIKALIKASPLNANASFSYQCRFLISMFIQRLFYQPFSLIRKTLASTNVFHAPPNSKALVTHTFVRTALSNVTG